ncbi:TetR/AcrR family transcriptional regulator [Fructobacillus ficulneus]|uniref:Transcriptional regulator, TetR family n=1 Tax=Fructobacillus ficulneus TaxID=157463 RepID=A0A0K8MIE7_9LACO|nr:helix-turn-helix domain-containing protein [Fructobacillus ficulneus]GAP00342.1 transcriptional regulator, TetR family [Fructobacillus ficulneus]
MEKNVKTRKCGSVLKNTIFKVTLQLFDDQGIEAVTFNNVAQKAETSRSVLYRRWDSPHSLLVDAVHNWAHENSGLPEHFDESTFPDTGSLHDDLLTHAKLITKLHDKMNQYFVKLSMYQMFNNETVEHDMLAEAETGILRLSTLVAERAIDRGELKQVPTPEVLMLLGNISRYYAFLSPEHKPSPESLIDHIVFPAWLANQAE